MSAFPEGFSYVPNFLTLAEQAALLRQIKELDYDHDRFRGQRLKRGYAQFGTAYVTTGRKLTRAAPLPDFLRVLIDKAIPHCPAGATFNQCIVTEYPESAGIDWHTDAPCFGEVIMAVSLGAPATLLFRANGTEAASCEVLATSGSLYVTYGPARWKHQHKVAPVAAERYSLTFRQVAENEREKKG